jgi:hypothetical protein
LYSFPFLPCCALARPLKDILHQRINFWQQLSLATMAYWPKRPTFLQPVWYYKALFY